MGKPKYSNNVPLYDEVSPRELYEISTGQFGDIERVLAGILGQINAHPEKLNRGH